MTDQIAVAYVGPKKEKRFTDPKNRVEHIFPQFEPVEVDADLAYRVLRFADVFVKGDDIKDAQKKKEAAEKERADREEKVRKAIEQAELNNQRVVRIEGTTYDLNKMTKPKLLTLVESLGLEVADNGEKKDDYAAAVKDAILNKYPDAAVNESQEIETAQSAAQEEAESEKSKKDTEEKKSDK